MPIEMMVPIKTNNENGIEEDDENIVRLSKEVENEIMAGILIQTLFLGGDMQNCPSDKKAENESRHVCRECGFHPEVGHKSRSLQKHMEEVHKKEKRFSCTVCDYKTNLRGW